MLKIIKNARIIAPEDQGTKDILVAGEKIVAVSDSIEIKSDLITLIDAKGKLVTPGLIDQHIHITGAGGKKGFISMTPEISAEELVSCGTTTVMGLLGTDGVIRNLKSLFAKVKSLEQEGLTAYMLTGYFGIENVSLSGSVLEDMILIDKVIGCKIALSDERSSFPSAVELLRIIREVYVGGLTSGKGGILHVHLGALDSRMDILFEMVNKYQFPIRYISPTHVGRTKALFDQAIEFAKLGGMIDISTGGTKYDAPHKQVLYALENNVPIENITFSSDGNAGMARRNKENTGFDLYKAPIDLNLKEVIALIKEGGVSPADAFKLITSNPAKNLSLAHKGKIIPGCDADFCFFDKDYKLCDVMSRGLVLMENNKITKKLIA